MNHEEALSSEIFTRRKFLEKAFGAGALLVAGELGFLGWLMAGEKKGQSDKLGIPDGTHVESLPWGGFSWTDYDTETLARMNGNLADLGKFKNTKTLWAPGEIGGAYPVTKEALRFLQRHLVFRAVDEYDEEKDSGWKPEDQETVQDFLNVTVERVLDFFGGDPLWVTGFIPVYRPGMSEREVIKKTFNMKDPRGGVFGNIGLDGEKSLYIAMLLGDRWQGGLKDYSLDEQTSFRAYLGHEVGHAVAGSKLNLPPFETHRLVDLAGRAFYFDQFREQDIRGKDLLFNNLTTGIEAPPWNLIQTLTGEDFYAELLQRLFAKHGRTSLSFSEEQVMEAGEEVFRKAGAPTSLKAMLDECPTGVCSLDDDCGPNSFCVNGSCVPKNQFEIDIHE